MLPAGSVFPGVSCTMKSSMRIPRHLSLGERSPLNTSPGVWAEIETKLLGTSSSTVSSDLGLSWSTWNLSFEVITSLHLCSFFCGPNIVTRHKMMPMTPEWTGVTMGRLYILANVERKTPVGYTWIIGFMDSLSMQTGGRHYLNAWQFISEWGLIKIRNFKVV